MSISDFKFLGYRVYSVVFHIADNYQHGEGEKELKQDIKIQRNFIPELPRSVEVDMSVTVKSVDDSVSFLVGLKGGFEASPDMTEELFQKLAKQNAPAILYPFVRAIMSSYTAQANIPPIMLPTLNFTEP